MGAKNRCRKTLCLWIRTMAKLRPQLEQVERANGAASSRVKFVGFGCVDRLPRTTGEPLKKLLALSFHPSSLEVTFSPTRFLHFSLSFFAAFDCSRKIACFFSHAFRWNGRDAWTWKKDYLNSLIPFFWNLSQSQPQTTKQIAISERPSAVCGLPGKTFGCKCCSVSPSCAYKRHRTNNGSCGSHVTDDG